MITGGQIRAGRAFAKLSAAELAQLARLARMTVVRAESVDGVPPVTESNLFSIQRALEEVGVAFGPDGGVNYRPSVKG
jgi:hypothetical protein